MAWSLKHRPYIVCLLRPSSPLQNWMLLDPIHGFIIWKIIAETNKYILIIMLKIPHGNSVHGIYDVKYDNYCSLLCLVKTCNVLIIQVYDLSICMKKI